MADNKFTFLFLVTRPTIAVSVGRIDDLLLASCLHFADTLHPRVQRGVNLGVKDIIPQLLHLTDKGNHLKKVQFLR